MQGPDGVQGRQEGHPKKHPHLNNNTPVKTGVLWVYMEWGMARMVTGKSPSRR
jgi:hypothetical protein